MNDKSAVLVTGGSPLACSVSVCLVQAGYTVTLLTENKIDAQHRCTTHFGDLRRYTESTPEATLLEIVESEPEGHTFSMGIALAEENLVAKKAAISRLESLLPADAPILISTETFDLLLLQKEVLDPARLVGVNWVEPAHTTYFLELISNEITDEKIVSELFDLAQSTWQKDPYRVRKSTGIRQKLMAALIREALFLVENGYASVEDIDRACRNDPGYYLPFAGNCRYMDLMGTYSYGMVMKDLNPELAKDKSLAPFFAEILKQRERGVNSDAGFYASQPTEAADWGKKTRRFSYQIQQLIEKYPFNQPKDADKSVQDFIPSNT